MRIPDVQLEWRIADVERKAEKANSRLYELDSLRSEMGRVERANRELSSEIDGLRSEYEVLQERVMRLEGSDG